MPYTQEQLETAASEILRYIMNVAPYRSHNMSNPPTRYKDFSTIALPSRELELRPSSWQNEPETPRGGAGGDDTQENTTRTELREEWKTLHFKINLSKIVGGPEATEDQKKYMVETTEDKTMANDLIAADKATAVL